MDNKMKKFKYTRGLLDKIVYLNFINQEVDDGMMIEVGGHTGDMGGSITYFFEKNLNYKTILIEPSKESFKKMVINRPNSININTAVNLEERDVTLYGVDAEASTYQKRNRSKSYVKGKPMSGILEPYDINHIDLFVIDTEGSELDVLTTFNWDIEVGYILVELLSRHRNPPRNYEFMCEKDDKVIKFLKDKNFIYEFSDYELTNQFWSNPNYSRKDILFRGSRDLNSKNLSEDHYLNLRQECIVDEYWIIKND
jgi:FkbM family methyltransferase